MFSFFKKKIIIPHVRLSGVIGSVGRFRQGIDFSGQQEIIKKAFSFKKAKSVAVSINSPGGSPVQSHLIHDYIRQLAKKNKKKVIVFAEDVAASGGYLIACAGDEIYANSSSIVGSIGVISASFGFQDVIKKIGIQRRVYTAGKNKSTLDPFKEEKEEDIERIKKLQLELHSDFINVVKKSRGSKLQDTEKNNTFTGEFWSGSTSLKLGLIDGIGNAEQILKEKFGENVVIKKLEKPKGFIARKLSASLDNQIDNIVNAIEERALWQKFGL
jgi:signal peptide peptidase SppA